MSLILHIETSTTVGSVCLSKDGVILGMVEEKESGDHARQLTLFVEELMQQCNYKLADLNAIAVGSGPGSYTGLRIGVSVVKGLCYSLNKPLIAVNTLEAMAYAMADEKGVSEQDILVSTQDARRMDAYAFVGTAAKKAHKESFFLTFEEKSFQELCPADAKIWVGGNAALKWKEAMPLPNNVHISSILAPSASFLMPLAYSAYQEKNFADLAYFEPFYLKAPNVTKPKSLL